MLGVRAKSRRPKHCETTPVRPVEAGRVAQEAGAAAPPASHSGRRNNGRSLLKIGLGGSALVALCCFTPALVLLLGAVGLSAWLAWLDYVLLPLLVLFLGITGYGFMRMRRR